jgi:hypothetical protein
MKTEEEIQSMQKMKWKRISKRINEINEKIKKENEEKSKSLNSSTELNPEKKELNFKKEINLQKFLGIVDKEKFLIIDFCKYLIGYLNRQSKKSTFLKCTTLTFIRRFYLLKSILDYDITYLMAAALYLGSKVSQMNLGFEGVEKIFGDIHKHEEKVFDYESYLCTILKYDFFVYNPYHALSGFLEQKDVFLDQKKENYIDPDTFKQECNDIIDTMYLTDIIFLYNYSEIALGSIFMVCEKRNIDIQNICNKLELNDVLDIKKFINGPLVKMKKYIDDLPKYETQEEEDKKADLIYKSIKHIHANYPDYTKKLEEERKTLKTKMENFSKEFNIWENDVLPKAKK